MGWGKFLFLFVVPFAGYALAPYPHSPMELIDKELRAQVGCTVPDPSKPTKASLFYWKAKYTKSEEERLRILEGALILAEGERALKPKDPRPLYDWIAIKGELSTLKNKLVALSYIKPLEKAAMELKALDPAFEGHAADRVLGYLYEKAPGLISIGSNKKAKEHFLLALAGAPEYPANQLSYAEFLLEKGDKVGAAYRAKRAIAAQSLIRFPIEATEWERQGNQILEATGDLALSTP